MVRKTAPKPVATEPPRLVGYARVSTAEQNLDMQETALRRAGCVNVYSEKVSAASSKRHKLALALKELREGDTLVVWKLDRLARSIRDLHKKLEEIQAAGASFRSLTESFDTSTAGGRMLMHVIAAMAEFERDLTIERTRAGMIRAQERGQRFGAKPRVTPEKLKAIIADLRERKLSVKDVAKKHGIATSTIYWLLPGGRAKVQQQRKR